MGHRIQPAVCAAAIVGLVPVGPAACTLAEGVHSWITDPSATAPPPGGVRRPVQVASTDAPQQPMHTETTPTGDGTPVAIDDGAGQPAAQPDEAAEPIAVDAGERYEGPDGRRLSVLESRRFDSGLVVHDLRLGEEGAATCEVDSQIVVRFHGTIADGPVIDTTRGGDPVGPWPLDQLMPGWQRGLVGMRAGGIRRLEIPAALAYGDLPVSDPDTGEVRIPAGSDLVYTVELIELRASSKHAGGDGGTP